MRRYVVLVEDSSVIGDMRVGVVEETSKSPETVLLQPGPIHPLRLLQFREPGERTFTQQALVQREEDSFHQQRMHRMSPVTAACSIISASMKNFAAQFG